MKTQFILPTSKLSVVVWYRNGEAHEQLINTPKNNDDLRNLMVMKYKVGFSEIRAVKSVLANNLFSRLGK